MAERSWLRFGLAALGLAGGARLASILVERQREVRLGRNRRGRARRRVVILGAGFGGLYAARRLEDLVGDDPTVELVLVDRYNYHLFTPMLTLVTNGLIQPRHVTYPVRRLQRGRSFRFRETDIRGIDLTRRTISTSDGSLVYDALVVALGAQTNYFGNAEIQRYAFPFKSLGDAMRLRNHIIDMFEDAAREDDPDRRRRLLTFVIVGGGATGVELAAALHDLVHHSLIYDYPALSWDDVTIILAEAADRLLPAMSPRMSAAATKVLRRKHIEIRLNTTIAKGGPGPVETAHGETISTRTLVWVAGVRAHDLVANLPVQKGKGGAAAVNDSLELLEQPGVFAIGDCAYYVDRRTGKPVPPDAQTAVQEGEAVAESVSAYLQGRRPPMFRYRRFGDMVSLGERTAIAEVAGLTLVGFPAWLLWRVYYIGRLQGIKNKLRVAGDFAIGMFSERDTARIEVA